MKFASASLMCDFYKLSHRKQYPEGTEVVYSTWTPRGSRMPEIKQVVAFGMQAAISQLEDDFQETFFSRRKDAVLYDYKRLIKHTLGDLNPETQHLSDLHDLGYLPISIKALPEGTLVPMRVPFFTIQNTDPRFFWLTNFLETWLSSLMWKPVTSATLAFEYRKVLERYAMKTVGNTDFVPFQGHDFSMRGMSSPQSAVLSGMGHLTSFVGTDTVPAILAMEEYYGADVEAELVGTSIPATEHSVQCAYNNDMAYFERMLEIYPSGLVSIVSDGYDFWEVIGKVLPQLHEKIMRREGKVVIRPDSGDPVKIVCGDSLAFGESALSRKGAVEALWDIFGGKINDKGYKELDPHIGLIYGDAITLERALKILHGLESKGFASTNIVFGVGSFTYQFNTRDTFGFAMKATACVINGVEKGIFKDPKTDDGVKKSQKGRVAVYQRCPEEQTLVAVDQLSLFGEPGEDLLKEIYCDGQWKRRTTLHSIRERLREQARG